MKRSSPDNSKTDTLATTTTDGASSTKTTNETESDINKKRTTIREIIQMKPTGIPTPADQNQTTTTSTTTQPSLAPQQTPTQSSQPVFKAPKLKIVDGKLVVDEASLKVSAAIEPQRVVNTVYEGSAPARLSTSDAYSKRGKRKKVERWSQTETARFYQTLRIFGTDFSLIAGAFKNEGRDRRQIKAKFKKEERDHPNLIDKALSSRLPLDEQKLRDAGVFLPDSSEPLQPQIQSPSTTPTTTTTTQQQQKEKEKENKPTEKEKEITEQERKEQEELEKLFGEE